MSYGKTQGSVQPSAGSMAVASGCGSPTPDEDASESPSETVASDTTLLGPGSPAAELRERSEQFTPASKHSGAESHRAPMPRAYSHASQMLARLRFAPVARTDPSRLARRPRSPAVSGRAKERSVPARSVTPSVGAIGSGVSGCVDL